MGLADRIEENKRISSGMGSSTAGWTPPKPKTVAPKREKTWDEMNESERKAALDKVDWDALGRMGGSSSSDTSSGSGSSKEEKKAEREQKLNTEAINQYYQNALAALLAASTQAGQGVAESIGRMQASPYNTANAYANLVAQAPTIAANPIAEYAAAAGLSPVMAEQQVALSQAQGDAYTKAMQNAIDLMSTSQQQANASRLADIGLIETGAKQDLATNQQMLQLALEKARIGDITGLQQQNLQNQLALRNALTSQIGSIFQGQNVAPESILKLIEEAFKRINTNQWTMV